ncbi:MAG: DUF3800 domain-containing protein [Anaerolineae bacterium]
MHIYVDEAGNLIGPEGEERIFLVGTLKTENNRAIRKLFERAKRHTLPKKQRHLTEIKASWASDRFRQRILRGLSKLDVEVHLAVCRVEQMPWELKGREGLVYLHLVRETIRTCLTEEAQETYVVIDKRQLHGISRANFDLHLRVALALHLPANARLEIIHRDSTTDPGLQASDYVCWAAFQKWQRGDPEWYVLIDSRVTTERIIWE